MTTSDRLFYKDLRNFLKSIEANLKEESYLSKLKINIKHDLNNFLDTHIDRIEMFSHEIPLYDGDVEEEDIL